MVKDVFVQGGYDNWWMSRENELPIFSCKCFIGHHEPVHIYRWGGGEKEFWREHLVFRGNGGGIRYTYSTSNKRHANNNYSVSRNGWFIFQQYLQRRVWNPVHSFEAQLRCKLEDAFLKDLHHYGCFCGVTKEMRSYKDPSAVKEKDPFDG